MNGIDAVAVAMGNDWRAIEAGAHAYAARSGHYTSLSKWWRRDGCLHGSIELPLAVGTVGGATNFHPTVKVLNYTTIFVDIMEVLRKLLGVESARELACVMAAVGLAQNLGTFSIIIRLL